MPSKFHLNLLMRLLVIALCLVLAGIAVICAPRPVLAAIAGGIAVVLSLGAIATVVVGIAITAVLKPLVPVSEISVLGKRVMAFLKFALATTAVFGIAFVGWAVAMSYEPAVSDSKRFVEITGQLMQLLSLPVAFAAIIFWMWLNIDLLRISRRKRANAIDLLARKTEPYLMAHRDEARRVAKWLVGEWWWILFAFYLAPSIVILLVGVVANSILSGGGAAT